MADNGILRDDGVQPGVEGALRDMRLPATIELIIEAKMRAGALSQIVGKINSPDNIRTKFNEALDTSLYETKDGEVVASRTPGFFINRAEERGDGNMNLVKYGSKTVDPENLPPITAQYRALQQTELALVTKPGQTPESLLATATASLENLDYQNERNLVVLALDYNEKLLAMLSNDPNFAQEKAQAEAYKKATDKSEFENVDKNPFIKTAANIDMIKEKLANEYPVVKLKGIEDGKGTRPAPRGRVEEEGEFKPIPKKGAPEPETEPGGDIVMPRKLEGNEVPKLKAEPEPMNGNKLPAPPILLPPELPPLEGPKLEGPVIPGMNTSPIGKKAPAKEATAPEGGAKGKFVPAPNVPFRGNMGKPEERVMPKHQDKRSLKEILGPLFIEEPHHLEQLPKSEGQKPKIAKDPKKEVSSTTPSMSDMLASFTAPDMGAKNDGKKELPKLENNPFSKKGGDVQIS